MKTAQAKAHDFLMNETAFRLGDLPTEGFHPKTHNLSQTITKDVEAGIRQLLSVDEDMVEALDRLFEQPGFEQLVSAIFTCLQEGGRIFFTGCGATGRLSILLEAAWREYWRGYRPLGCQSDDYLERCVSVMAGGDYALIKSVEGFEDVMDFGRYQLREVGVKAGDLVVAITEGGETSFVIGTAWEGLEAGATVFFVYNNPTEILKEQVERSRDVIDDPRVHTLDLYTGPMAISGSTRMQATTVELLVVATALEQSIAKMLHECGMGCPPVTDIYKERFRGLMADLTSPESITAMAAWTKIESNIYRREGLITYAANWGLLDVLTDTTERSPTFHVPAFRADGENSAEPSWAFVKNPFFDTTTAWELMLQRPPRGLTWDAKVYQQLQAPATMQAAPPHLSKTAIEKFQIGHETDPTREPTALIMLGLPIQSAMLVTQCQQHWPDHPEERYLITIGGGHAPSVGHVTQVHCPCTLPDSPLQLWKHLAFKLVLNTVSTATMAHLGRIYGNAMVWVSPSCKKLIDRGCRLIARTVHCTYEQACFALFEQMEKPQSESTSPVALAIKALGGKLFL